MTIDRTCGTGIAIREHRKRLGLTQAELAKALGMERTSVVNIEAGRQALSVEALVAAATAIRGTLSSPADLLENSTGEGVN